MEHRVPGLGEHRVRVRVRVQEALRALRVPSLRGREELRAPPAGVPGLRGLRTRFIAFEEGLEGVRQTESSPVVRELDFKKAPPETRPKTLRTPSTILAMPSTFGTPRRMIPS